MYSTIGTDRTKIGIMSFALRLKIACQERRFTNQRELAELASVTKSSLNRWLSGPAEPSVTEAYRLAKVLGVPLEWLADEDATWPPPSPESESDETAVLDLYRALRLSKEEALRRLATPVGETQFEQHGTALVLSEQNATQGHLARQHQEAERQREAARKAAKEKRSGGKIESKQVEAKKGDGK